MNGVPVLYNNVRVSKDAAREIKISYSWDGNNAQQLGNIVYIYDNETNELAYTSQSSSYKQECTVPAGKLKNGILYKVSVCVVCGEGISPPSDPMLFYCYSTPTFFYTDLKPDQIIENNNYTVHLSYSQPEGEELESYYIDLCAGDKSVVYTSSVKYDTSDIALLLSGLANNAEYYIKAYGKTITGMEFETDYVHISVRYLEPTVYALVELSDDEVNGYTTIKSNIVSLEAAVYRDGLPVDPVYIGGEFLDLKDPGTYAKFDKGFSALYDFTLEFKGYSIRQNTIPMVLSNGAYQVCVYYREGKYDSAEARAGYFELRVVGELTYSIISNYIPVPGETDLVGFQISRKNNIYEIFAHNYAADLTGNGKE